MNPNLRTLQVQEADLPAGARPLVGDAGSLHAEAPLAVRFPAATRGRGKRLPSPSAPSPPPSSAASPHARRPARFSAVDDAPRTPSIPANLGFPLPPRDPNAASAASSSLRSSALSPFPRVGRRRRRQVPEPDRRVGRGHRAPRGQEEVADHRRRRRQGFRLHDR